MEEENSNQYKCIECGSYLLQLIRSEKFQQGSICLLILCSNCGKLLHLELPLNSITLTTSKPPIKKK